MLPASAARHRDVDEILFSVNAEFPYVEIRRTLEFTELDPHDVQRRVFVLVQHIQGVAQLVT